jgi:hypothetical protein
MWNMAKQRPDSRLREAIRTEHRLRVAGTRHRNLYTAPLEKRHVLDSAAGTGARLHAGNVFIEQRSQRREVEMSRPTGGRARHHQSRRLRKRHS